MAQGIQMRKPNSQKIGRTKPHIEVTTSKKCRTRHVWLNVLPDDLWLRVCEGDTVLEALQERGVDVGGECGGLGKCGKCKIKVLSSVGPPTKEEESLLDEEELEQGIRLACRTIVDKDLVIQTGESESTQEYFQILKSGQRPLFHLDPLIRKRLIALPPELQNEGLSDVDRIKMAVVPEHEELKVSLFCLQTLPEMLRNTTSQAAAVLDDNRLLAWQEPSEVWDRRYQPSSIREGLCEWPE
jgi:ferredoxin